MALPIPEAVIFDMDGVIVDAYAEIAEVLGCG